jgi:cell fate regulator YaaT (PSP1 superfamily)
MSTVVGVRFREAGKLYHFDPGDLDLHRLDRVVVETAHGVDIGRVVTERLDRDEADGAGAPLRRVLRRATEADLDLQRDNREAARAALSRAKRRAQELGLDIRLVEGEYTFDRGKLTLFFTAEDRVDFRALARDLADELRVRVELRQIGARDEAKLIDGIGPCGERLCCSRWLTEFQPISIKMAKLQNLALNPGKLAGACGRLKCCLRYEVETYEQGQREMPKVGATVYTRQGEGRVVGTNVLARSVSVLLDGAAPQTFDVDEVFDHACGGGPGGAGCTCGGKR